MSLVDGSISPEMLAILAPHSQRAPASPVAFISTDEMLGYFGDDDDDEFGDDDWLGDDFAGDGQAAWFENDDGTWLVFGTLGLLAGVGFIF